MCRSLVRAQADAWAFEEDLRGSGREVRVSARGGRQRGAGFSVGRASARGGRQRGTTPQARLDAQQAHAALRVLAANAGTLAADLPDGEQIAGAARKVQHERHVAEEWQVEK